MIRLILLLIAITAPVHAGPDRVSLMLGSYHVAAKMPFEQVNPGVFLTWENRAAGLDYSLGVYRNSYGRVSVAGIAAWPVWQHGETQASLFAGIAHYPKDGRRFAIHAGDFVPLVGAQIRHRNLFIQAMPGDGKFAAGILSMGLTFRIQKGH